MENQIKTFIEHMKENPCPPPFDPPPPPRPSLAERVATYVNARETQERAAEAREELGEYLASTRTKISELEGRVRELGEAWEQAVGTPGAEETKAARNRARVELADTREELTVLTGREATLPLPDYALVHDAKCEIYLELARLELASFPPEALLVLHQAHAAALVAGGSGNAWKDWLANALPAPETSNNHLAGLLAKHKVQL